MPPSERKAAEGRIAGQADRKQVCSVMRTASTSMYHSGTRQIRAGSSGGPPSAEARGRSAGVRGKHMMEFCFVRSMRICAPVYSASPSPGPGVRKRPIRVRMSWWSCRGTAFDVPVQGSDTAADSMTLIWRKTPDVRVRRWPFPARLRMNCPRMPADIRVRYIFTEKEMITCF